MIYNHSSKIYTETKNSFLNALNVLSDEFNKIFFDADNIIKKALSKKKN